MVSKFYNFSFNYVSVYLRHNAQTTMARMVEVVSHMELEELSVVSWMTQHATLWNSLQLIEHGRARVKVTPRFNENYYLFFSQDFLISL